MTTERERTSFAKQSLVVAVVTVVGLALVAVLAFAGYRWSGVGMQTPRTELAQWLPAVSSVLTLTAAVAAAVFAAGALRIESRREQRERDDIEKLQATTVAAWGSNAGVGRTGVAGGATVTYTLDRAQLLVRNGSNLPIYDLRFVAKLMSTDAEIDGAPLTFPGGATTIPLVSPADTITYGLARHEFSVAAPKGFDGNTGMPSNHIVVAIQFRDTAGTYWRRHTDGEFEQGAGELH